MTEEKIKYSLVGVFQETKDRYKTWCKSQGYVLAIGLDKLIDHWENTKNN